MVNHELQKELSLEQMKEITGRLEPGVGMIRFPVGDSIAKSGRLSIQKSINVSSPMRHLRRRIGNAGRWSRRFDLRLLMRLGLTRRTVVRG